MRNTAFRNILALFAGMTLLAGCSNIRYQQSNSSDDEALQLLHQQLAEDPANALAARDLGVLYVQRQQPAEGLPYLETAFIRIPNDPETLFYLGLVTEMEVGMQEALDYYARHTSMPFSSPFRRLSRGRWQWISEELAREELRTRLVEEGEFDVQNVDPSVVAVFPLRFQGVEEFDHLGRAFSELVLIDLSSIERIQLVERVRIKILLDELNLANEVQIDQGTSPRLGRLVGAGHLIGGTLSVLDGEGLQVDFASWMPSVQTNPAYLRHGGRLSHFFDIEKEVVFAVLGLMGIEPTPQEVDQIQRIPTQNMQAFLAYSQGLNYEARGMYSQAEGAFNEAVMLDPGFLAAVEAVERAGASAAGSGEAMAVLDAVNGGDEGGNFQEGVDLMGLRMSIFTGGAVSGPADGRQPAAEAASASNPNLSDPPAPPGNN